jgi:hypothetical protein
LSSITLREVANQNQKAKALTGSAQALQHRLVL